MRFQFLGTAAAEAIPARFCECPVCRKARELKGREIRKRASYLIDDDILVDIGPDSFFQEMLYDIDYLKLKRLIITHPHCDHLLTSELLWRYDLNYSKVSQDITIYGGYHVFSKIMGDCCHSCGAITPAELHFKPVVVQPGKLIAEENFELLPMAANHMPGGTPMIYIVKRGDKKVLICNDTGWMCDETWQSLAGAEVDMALIDSTCGIVRPDVRNGHMGVNTVKAVVAELKKIKAVKDSARIIATHFSHNGGGNHADYEAVYNPDGIEVAYDGMIVEL
jgi:phosphoribosyl 1,2-cyclic phosphate phosphodiesterase